MTETTPSPRRVSANLALSLDGRYHGPGGPADFGAFAPYVATDTAREHLTRIWSDATTAVLGRVNAEGFLGYWPSVADDPTADPRDRAYARWLVDTEKVVFSTTMTTAPWPRTRLVSGSVADTVAALRTAGTGEILVNSSPSLIKPLLAADLVDRLYLMVLPTVVGAGQRLFEDGLPASTWTLTRLDAGDTGELALVYDRLR